MKISEFKKGAIITRVEPIAVKVNGFSMYSETTYDYTCVGEKLELMCIANGKIYLKNCDCNKGGDIIELFEFKFRHHWENYKTVVL